MTQSDSPDFEFDVSDLEVEGDDAPASREGEDVSRETVEGDGGSGAQVSDREELKGEKRIDPEDDPDDAELSGFAIDELPDSYSPPIADAVSEEESEEAEAANASEAGVTGEAERIDSEPRSMRDLGEDDLGADVFSEIDEDGEGLSFEDAIADLMEEVDDYEAGGFVDLDEEAGSVEAGADGNDPFKLEDPDDSLGQSVQPEAPEANAASSSTAFPSPPVDFEIPADPEESESEAEGPIEASAESREQPVEDAAEAPDFSKMEIPADPPPSDGERETGRAEQPSGVAEAKADDETVAPEPPIGEPDTLDASEPAAASEADEEPTAEEREREPAKGSERVFFDAKAEAAAQAAEAREQALESDPEAARDHAADEDDGIAAEGDALPPETDEAGEEEPSLKSIDGEEAPIGETEAAQSALPEEAQEPTSVESASEADSGEATDSSEGEETEKVAESTEDASTEEEEASEEAIDADAASDGDQAPEAEETISEEEQDIESLVAESFAETAEDEPSDEEASSDAEAYGESVAASDEAEAEPMGEEGESVAESDRESPREADADALEAEGSEGADEEEALDEEAIAAMLSDESDSDEDGESGEESATDAEREDAASEESEDEEDVVPEAEADDPPAEDEEEPIAAMPSAEELLKQAGSLLNKGAKPADEASSVLDAIDDDEDGLVSMPSPDAMMAEAAGEADSSDEASDDEEEVMAMPDPSSLMAEASGGKRGEPRDEEAEPSASGNVADRAGDLPPPPPAPVEILDEEPLDEDVEGAEPESEEAESEEAEASEGGKTEEGELEDPFASEITLDDFSEEFNELDGLDDGPLDPFDDDTEAAASGREAKGELAFEAAALPKPSLWWRLTHSMAVAAGLAFFGAASLFFVWRQEVIEYFEGRDIDGSALITQIRKIGLHALEDFDEHGLYRMQWVDSEVKRVSKNEIRLYALVGAQLRENLYQPVLESELSDSAGYDETALLAALSKAHGAYPEEIGNFPDKPWETLYRLSASKDEIVPLRVMYGLSRSSETADWTLSRVKVTGYQKELAWPEGEPKYAFGERAYDIESDAFAEALRGYREESERYIARISDLEAEEERALAERERENARQRERVRLSLEQGTFFDGVAIIGEDAERSQDVKLVITEAREGGAFLKGVFQTSDGGENRVKHFVGSLDFEETLSGKEQGVLKLTTVSVDAAGEQSEEVAFFDPNSVSRIRLKADGFRLEGDSRNFSLRLTRAVQ